MRILFAASDRDLLGSYQKLLTDAFGACATAFDGAQALAALADADERPGLVVLDRDLPRVQVPDILRQLSQEGLPSIVLLDGPATAHQLIQEPLPCAFLSHPFFPEELVGLIKKVADQAHSAERFSAGGVTVDVPAFRIEGGPRLTVTEIDLLRALMASNAASPPLAIQSAAPPMANQAAAPPLLLKDPAKIGAAVSALNEKFLRLGAPARIRYRPKKGFELVADYD